MESNIIIIVKVLVTRGTNETALSIQTDNDETNILLI